MALGYFLSYYLPLKKGRVGEIRKRRETPLVPLSSQQADFPRRSGSWNHQECVFVLASSDCGGKRGPLGGSQKAMPELLTG